jgi:predicted metal-dependent enzyme (double-stranded beta helix superfamily)
MTNKAPRTLLTLITLCVGAAAPSPAQSYPPPFPRAAAHMLFENGRVAVWDVTWPKGQPTSMHEHPVDQLSVTLVGGTKRVTRLGGTPAVSESRRGQIVLTPKGTVHMEEGLSDIPERKIMLQLKSSESPGITTGDIPGAFPREGAVKLMENARAVVWDFTWKPGQKTLRHADYVDSVIVFLEGGTVRSIADRGGSEDSARSPDEVVYSPHSADPRTEEAVRGSPRAIIVELK